MSFSPYRFKVFTALGAVIMTLGGLLAVEAAAAEESGLQTLRAPFECGSEWAGGTRSGHGLNNWNLDINRTSRTFSDPQHDLGQPLLAQADGTVVWIGTHYSAGTYVEIDYGDITARYVHVVHDSIPDDVEIGDRVAEGQLFGLLGDTGNATHAHLHLEYFDSRDYDDARAYILPSSNQIQITMDGEPIDPGEAFVSTNCDGAPPLPPSSSTTTTTTEAPHPFLDIELESFAYDDVALLYELGITTGTSAESFSPGDEVTHEQMAAFLGRLWEALSPAGLPEADAGGEFPFEDVDPDSFAYEHIERIYRLGITTGTAADAYSPTDLVTREQMAAFLGRLWTTLSPAAQPEVGPSGPDSPPFPFLDVTADSFARSEIDLIWRLGITTGTSPDVYSPADDVTREQMAAFLARLHRSADAE